jgi:Uma2 family endonuclease
MATMIDSPPVAGAEPILLHGITWAVYEGLLHNLENSRQRMYLTYDRGTLEIMAPSSFHERYKSVIDRLIGVMSLELNIPISSFGSTTFKREDLERGLEPDECYYIQHEPQMGAKFDLDLTSDPPPDLAIEMDHTHHAIDRDDVYGALGVPEIWQFDGKRLVALKRNEAGQYEAIEKSIAFPFLLISDFERFVLMAGKVGELKTAMAFRDWLQKTHLPRS